MNETMEKGIPIDRIYSIYSYVLKIVRKFRFDEHTCLDVAQEIVMKLYLKSDSFAAKSRLKTWIYSIAKNHCINYKNRIYDKTPLPVDFSGSVSYESISENAESNFLTNELKDKLSACIQKLPEHLKAPLVYFYYDNLKYSEISNKMDIPIGTVKSRINTAKNFLRNLLEQQLA
jgi:RNA polymerase sigma-70 factor (ECF subfamily)